jgi:hypothetical protein
MHELMHSFGFASYVREPGYNPGRNWSTFAGFIVTNDAAYGRYVPLYTPDPWSPGSSLSHLDDDTFAGVYTQLMDAHVRRGPATRALSAIELAIMRDIGYSVLTYPTQV